jgi:hypothetical protein
MIASLNKLFCTLNLNGIRIVWEIRRRNGDFLPAPLIALMEKYDMIHCVDLTKENPAFGTNVMYTRIFGKGKHTLYQFSDEELLELNGKITVQNPEKALVSFHNVRMYKDAARYQLFRKTNRFPSVTKARGLQSLRRVLLEDACFPATADQLIENQGWKIIDLTDDKRVHARTLLEKLPHRIFVNADDVLHSFP